VASEFWTASSQMITAGGIVAAFAIPVGLICWVVSHRGETSQVMPLRPWRVPWGGIEVLLAFVLIAVVPQLLLEGGLHPLVAGVVALPIQLLLLLIGWRLVCPSWLPSYPKGIAIRFVLAVVAWALITPPVLVVNAVVLQIFAIFDWPAEEHPLTQLGDLTKSQRVLFFLQACVSAPLIEEVLFRGLLLWWVIGTHDHRIDRFRAPQIVAPAHRPWMLMAFTLLYAGLTEKVGPTVWALLLLLGLILVWVTKRHGRRHIRGIYATASLFAVVHSQVWPSPIPLFILGLALGWLAVRTRGVMVPFLVHGLFNAVAVVFVLRSSPG